MQQAVMMKSRPQDEYRKQGVMTASPVELVVMLYDALKKNLVLGQRKIGKRDVQGAHDHLIKAQDIVNELVSCLDMSFPISEELLNLYEFILRSVGEANIRKNAEPLEVVIEIVDNLREAWKEVSMSSRGSMELGDD